MEDEIIPVMATTIVQVAFGKLNEKLTEKYLCELVAQLEA